MGRLDSFVAERRARAARYHEALASLPVKRPLFDNNSAWHLYMIEVDPAQRTAIFNTLRAAGIGVNVHYIPIHLHPYYQALGFGAGDFPVSEQYYRGALTLPLYPLLTDSEQQKVIDCLKEVLL